MILIHPDRFKLALLQILKSVGIESVTLADSKTSTSDEIANTKGDTIISFQSGLILKPNALNGRRCYNFHAATPDYPGRDPHHWAIYEGAKEFGVTLHLMNERVDEGQILAVTRFDIEPGITPQKLRRQGDSMSVWMFQELIPRILSGEIGPNGEQWTGKKRKRQDLLDLLAQPASLEEKRRREFAFEGFIETCK